MKSMHIRVTETELRRANQESVALTEEEGGGYLAWLGVFHELHCIVRMLSLYKTCDAKKGHSVLIGRYGG